MIGLIFVLLQASQCCAVASQEGPPTITVQTVDPLWLPLPGVNITITPRTKGARNATAVTDARGIAKFWLQQGAEYAIEGRLEGFKAGRVKSVRTVSAPHNDFVPQVQIRLELSGHFETVQ